MVRELHDCERQGFCYQLAGIREAQVEFAITHACIAGMAELPEEGGGMVKRCRYREEAECFSQTLHGRHLEVHLVSSIVLAEQIEQIDRKLFAFDPQLRLIVMRVEIPRSSIHWVANLQWLLLQWRRFEVMVRE